MKTYKYILQVFVIAAAAICSALDARSQPNQAVRKPIPEGSITMPDYYGVYAVQDSGETLALEMNNTDGPAPMTMSLPANVEFLVFGSDIKPSEYRLLTETPANIAQEIRLLAKPVSNQPQMLRLIPERTLSNGQYGLLKQQGLWVSEAMQFIVGSGEAHSPDTTGKVNKSKRSATFTIKNGTISLLGLSIANMTISLDNQEPFVLKPGEESSFSLPVGSSHTINADKNGERIVRKFVVNDGGGALVLMPQDF